MAFRIFIAVVLAACAYFAFETVRLSMLRGAFLDQDDLYVIAPAEADLTFVKFLDYSCSFCKDAHQHIKPALERDGRVRFIPRPVDILNAEGLRLARLPYAAAKQGKFADMHEALIDNFRAADDSLLEDLAAQIGLDPVQLRKDYESEEVIKKAQENLDLFNAMRLQSIPSYAVGRHIVFSPRTSEPTTQDFINIFNEARNMQ